MLILTIRTDKPEAEIGLFNGSKQLEYHSWQAHRLLAETIHVTIKEVLKKHSFDWADIGGIVFYKGPGSFTGLRIGASVANALAQGGSLPLVCVSGDDWVAQGIHTLLDGHNDKVALPDYGNASITTQQKK